MSAAFRLLDPWRVGDDSVGSILGRLGARHVTFMTRKRGDCVNSAIGIVISRTPRSCETHPRLGLLGPVALGRVFTVHLFRSISTSHGTGVQLPQRGRERERELGRRSGGGGGGSKGG